MIFCVSKLLLCLIFVSQAAKVLGNLKKRHVEEMLRINEEQLLAAKGLGQSSFSKGYERIMSPTSVTADYNPISKTSITNEEKDGNPFFNGRRKRNVLPVDQESNTNIDNINNLNLYQTESLDNANSQGETYNNVERQASNLNNVYRGYNTVFRNSESHENCNMKSLKEYELEKHKLSDLQKEVEKLNNILLLIKLQHKVINKFNETDVTIQQDKKITKLNDTKPKYLEIKNNSFVNQVPTHQEIDKIKEKLSDIVSTINQTSSLLSFERNRANILEISLKEQKAEIQFLKTIVTKIIKNPDAYSNAHNQSKTTDKTQDTREDVVVGSPIHLPKHLPTNQNVGAGIMPRENNKFRNKSMSRESLSDDNEVSKLLKLITQSKETDKPKETKSIDDNLKTQLEELEKKFEKKQEQERLIKALKRLTTSSSKTTSTSDSTRDILQKLIGSSDQPQTKSDNLDSDLKSLEIAINSLRPKDEPTFDGLNLQKDDVQDFQSSLNSLLNQNSDSTTFSTSPNIIKGNVQGQKGYASMNPQQLLKIYRMMNQQPVRNPYNFETYGANFPTDFSVHQPYFNYKQQYLNTPYPYTSFNPYSTSYPKTYYMDHTASTANNFENKEMLAGYNNQNLFTKNNLYSSLVPAKSIYDGIDSKGYLKDTSNNYQTNPYFSPQDIYLSNLLKYNSNPYQTETSQKVISTQPSNAPAEKEYSFLPAYLKPSLNINAPQFYQSPDNHQQLYSSLPYSANSRNLAGPATNYDQKSTPDSTLDQSLYSADSTGSPQSNYSIANYGDKYQMILNLKNQIDSLENVIQKLNQGQYQPVGDDQQAITNLEQRINYLKDVITSLNVPEPVPENKAPLNPVGQGSYGFPMAPPQVPSQDNKPPVPLAQPMPVQNVPPQNQPYKSRRRRQSVFSYPELVKSQGQNIRTFNKDKTENPQLNPLSQISASFENFLKETIPNPTIRSEERLQGLQQELENLKKELGRRSDSEIYNKNENTQVYDNGIAPTINENSQVYHNGMVPIFNGLDKIKSTSDEKSRTATNLGQDIFTSIIIKIIDKILNTVPEIVKHLFGHFTGQQGNSYGSYPDIYKKFGTLGAFPMVILKIFEFFSFVLRILKKNSFFKQFVLPGVVFLLVGGSILFVFWFLQTDVENISYQPVHQLQYNPPPNKYDDVNYYNGYKSISK